MMHYILPILLLVLSNTFMTFAWYGHLDYKSAPLLLVIFISWGIALFEYFFAVSANRIGSQVYSLGQLKTIQEVITLLVFAIFSVFWMKQGITWTTGAGFAFIALGAALVFRGAS